MSNLKTHIKHFGLNVPSLILVVCVPMGACRADTSVHRIGRTSLTGSSEDISNTNETITLTEKDHDTVVKLRTGSRLIIRLHAIPATGYGWQMIKNTTPHLKLIEQPAYEEGEHGVLGGPATEVFRFVTSITGSGDLELHYRRAWEKAVPPEKVFRVKILVEEMGTLNN